jgi:myosin heavy subunit
MASYAVGDRVWVPHDTEAWVVGEITGLSKSRVQLSTSEGAMDVSTNSVPPIEICGSHLDDDIDNLVDLDELSEGAILHHVRKRYFRKMIYTLVGPILVAVNPFERLPIYESGDVRKAQAHASIYPHIFVTAAIAYSQLRDNKKSQSVLISGESGAGKTETTKKVLQYLATVASAHDDGHEVGVEERIMQSNPLLEAMGNAKTLRNNNSSRFGKYMKIDFDRRDLIQGCSIVNYLLEKSRVVLQSKMERSYHIFYQLCAGAEKLPFASELNVKGPNEYRYLNRSGCSAIEGVDDSEEFHDVITAMRTLQFGNDEQQSMFSIVTAVLNLGNILFEKGDGNADDSRVDKASRGILDIAARLLGLDSVALSVALTEKTMTVGREMVTVLFSPLQAADNRDTLAKALYGSLFDWVVNSINDTLKGEYDPQVVHSIGILDIFGFEVFDINSFEQLCINYANEKLQLHFNSVVFGQEMQMYESEGIPLVNIDFVDNNMCVHLIENRKLGLISLLEEECSLGNGKDLSYVNKIDKAFGAGRKDTNPHFVKNKIKPAYFTVKHFAGDVEYFVDGWLDKNRDTLSQTLKTTMFESSNALVSSLFTISVTEPGSSAIGASNKPTSTKRTLGGQFRSQLADLVSSLHTTEPHFVRCIKPNGLKAASILEGTIVLGQMRYSGLFEAIRIRKSGYAYRASHEVFCNQYKILVDELSTALESGQVSQKEACERIIDECISVDVLPRGVCHAGKTRVFLKANQHRTLLERYKRVRVERYAIIIQNAFRSHRAYIKLNFARFQKKQEELRQQREKEQRRAACISIQAHMRGMLARLLVQNMGDLVAMRNALKTRNVPDVMKYLYRLESSKEIASDSKLGNVFRSEIATARTMVKLIEHQNNFLLDLENDLLESNIESVHEALKRVETLQLTSHPIVLKAQLEIKTIFRKRTIIKNMVKFLQNSDEFDSDPSTLLNEAVDLGVDPSFIDKVRRANDSAGPRLRAREGIRKAIETVDEAGIKASLIEIAALQKFHPKFLQQECLAGKAMLKMIIFGTQLSSSNSSASSNKMETDIDGPRLTPSVLALCEEMCTVPKDVNATGVDSDAAVLAMKKLQLMTRSQDALEEIIRCFKWSKLLCTWKFSSASNRQYTAPLSDDTCKKGYHPECQFFGLDINQARSSPYVNHFLSSINNAELTPSPSVLQSSATGKAEIGNGNVDYGNDVGHEASSEGLVSSERDTEKDSIVPESVMNELAQLDRLFRQHVKHDKDLVAFDDPEGGPISRPSTTPSVSTARDRPDSPKHRSQQDCDSKRFQFVSAESRRRIQQKAIDADRCSSLIPPSVSRVIPPAVVKQKSRTEFISLSSGLENKLLASRAAASRQKRRKELLVSHIKSVRASKNRDKDKAWR